jgi:hypothetical protein
LAGECDETNNRVRDPTNGGYPPFMPVGSDVNPESWRFLMHAGKAQREALRFSDAARAHAATALDFYNFSDGSTSSNT